MKTTSLPLPFSPIPLTPPATFPAPGFAAPGVQALFFESVPYHGHATRVFAWMGVPHVKPGTSCPGIVLLHGGGGTAFDEWVRLWNARGYAAIAMDLCGCVPAQPVVHDGAPHQRHEYGGPPGWSAAFTQITETVDNQWVYHAVAAAVAGHSLLAMQSGVDPDRIGATGISWGGYLTSIMAGVDHRLRAAVPVYGCGFLGADSVWSDAEFRTFPSQQVQQWLELWDPSRYLPQASMPMCWVSGTNDFAYPLSSLKKSYTLPAGPQTLCLRIEMPHGHMDGWHAPETAVFCDSILHGGAPLPQTHTYGRDGENVWAHIVAARPVTRVELCTTRASGHWTDRKWIATPAHYDPVSGRIEAALPWRTTAWFFNIFDDRDCVASTPHEEVLECGSV